MNIQLINEPNPKWSAVQQILYNRGIPQEEIKHYMDLNDNDINDAETLGIERLKAGVAAIIETIKKDEDALVIVDSDADGFCSSALLLNYLYRLFPSWIKNHVTWVMHDSKQHGLKDHMDYILNFTPSLVFCADSASNDYSEHEIIKNYGGQVLVLDHHLADKISENAIIINNQLSDYPNKEFCGCGVTWQFCKFIDRMLNIDNADEFLDLVALANVSDMMDIRSFETKRLIEKGFKKDNIKNPFIEYMIDKNNFPLNKSEYKSNKSDTACTPMGAAFFITPFVNAITRSGTMKEKELIFKSMLEYEAFTRIPEVKRNKQTGKEEPLVLQAVRVIGNVKNRQTRAEEAGLTLLESMIKEKNMLKYPILFFLLEPGQIQPEIRGLIANKMMAKYQRPCAILTHTGETYSGSMRGYTKNGLASFKALLEQCPGVEYVQGHDNAAGLSITASLKEDFFTTADNLMTGISADPLYRVDYYFKNITDKDNDIIIDIANLNDYWGQNVDRAYVAIRFKVTDKNFAVMKSNTLKITINDKLSLIMFGGSDEDIAAFTTTGWTEIEAVCKCNINSWNGIDYPQLMIEDYEILDSCKYIF